MTPASLNAMWSGKRGANAPVKLMGFRGGLEPSGAANSVGIYDDLIAVIIDGAVTWWKAAVDPAPALIRNPINPDGAAQLLPGVHLFKPGLHKGNPAWPCLIQAEGFHIARLAYGADGRLFAREIQFGDFGIHIHSGGDGDDVRRFTAGCQIIRNNDGYFGAPTWLYFYQPIVKAMQRHNLSTVPYLLTAATGLTPSQLKNA